MVKRGFSVLMLFLLLLFPVSVVFAQNPFEQGLKDYQNENYEEALEYFLQARKLEPTSTRVAFFIGLTYKQMEKFGEAIPYFKDAVSYTPKIKEALTELIDCLYQTNNLAEAKQWIAVGEKEGLSSGNLEFLKGLVLLKDGKTREAIQAFEKAKTVDSRLAQAADFQIANAHLKEGRLKDAQSRFRSAMALDPTSDLATYSRDYEKLLTEKMERERPWRFNIGVGYKSDSNVITKPMSGPVADSISNESDEAINTTLRASYTAPFSFTGPHSFFAQYVVSSDKYLKTTTNDMISQSITLMPGYSWSRASVTLPVSYQFAVLGHKKYVQTPGINPTLRISVTQRNAIDVSVGYQWKHYFQELQPGIKDADESRDAYNCSSALGWTYFTEKNGIFSIRYTYSKENADGTNWTFKSNDISVSIVHPIFTEKLRLQLSGQYTFIEYENINTVHGIERRDDYYTGSVGASYEILKNTDLIARYTYTRNKSNLEDFYGYKREIFFVGIEYNF